MRYIMLFVFAMLFTLLAIGQYPKGLPSPYSNGFSQIGYAKNDSGFIIAKRDTNWLPRFAGTMVLWQHSGVDSSLWIWNSRWAKIESSGYSKSTIDALIASLSNVYYPRYNNPSKYVKGNLAAGYIPYNYGSDTLGSSQLYQNGDGTVMAGFRTNNGLRLQVQGSFYVNDNIGIAVDTPSARLHIQKDTSLNAFPLFRLQRSFIHNFLDLDIAPLTQNSLQTLQDKSGVIALKSDISNTSTPTVTVGTNAGTGATATFLAGSNSTRGAVLIHTGTSPLSGAIFLCRITFGTPYSSTPFVIAMASDNPTLAISAFAPQSTASTTDFQINCNSSVSANTYYQVNYIVSQ